MQEEIREEARDIACQVAKEGEMPACQSCELLGLKLVCSVRHTADDIIEYLHSRGVLCEIGDCMGEA